MYYVENGQYHWKHHLAKLGKLPQKRGFATLNYHDPKHWSENPEATFKSHVVFGAIEEKGLPTVDFDFPKPMSAAEAYAYDDYDKRWNKWANVCYAIVDDHVKAWCDERFDRLMAAFERDMVDFWGPDVLVG